LPSKLNGISDTLSGLLSKTADSMILHLVGRKRLAATQHNNCCVAKMSIPHLRDRAWRHH